MKKLTFLPLAAIILFTLTACSPTKEAGNTVSGDSANAQPKTNEEVKPADDAKTANVTAPGASLASCIDSCKIIEADTGLISKETCRVGCYMAEAQEKKDPEVCTANVSDALMLPACLTGVAEAIQDITICDKIGPDQNDLMRGACYTSVVEKTKDATACEGIKSSMMYSGCVGAAAQQ